MHIRFLLGPAGSGKTHRCLTEIREALRNDPGGLPLVLLAPKQATFQLERQLLSFGNLSGYTRLRILSFERLAQFVFEQLNRPLPKLLSEDGRVMVLRALLERQRTALKLFRASARMPGFATQLSQLLRELQQYHFTPDRLETLSREVGDSNRLNSKLHDLAMILRAYSDWLRDHQLQDADCLLDLAEALASADFKTGNNGFRIEALWLDGFAQMTPQERQLLATVAQHSERTTLAFCLDGQPQQNPPWHSLWAPVTETFLRCRDQFSILPDAQITIEALSRNPARSRFASQPALQHLEQHWSGTTVFSSKAKGSDSIETVAQAPLSPREERTGREPERGETDLLSNKNPLSPDPLLRLRSEEREEISCTESISTRSAVRIVSCTNSEAEVEFAAREIHRYVRESGGRFRDTAVLLRSLDGYHDAVRRVFKRYQIPFFLDRRESVAHHPLAELTRYALRMVAFGWEHDDWFGALKTGLVHNDESAIDRLENEALARGWRGRSFWTQPLNLPGLPEPTGEYFERLREKLIPAFLTFTDMLESVDHRFSGKQLAEAIRKLWRDLKIDRKLDQWSSNAAENSLLPNPTLHETVWEQMADWLKNIELAFAEESLFPNEWLPIAEAGLGNLTVGVIPPALDQVLVGAVDRSRNPDLQITFVLGANEGVFPAPPATPALLHRVDREKLALHNAPVGPDFLSQIGLERYYGYIACTRARNQVILTFAHRDNGGQELNPSVFVSDLQRLFPALTVEEFTGIPDWKAAEHWSELLFPLLSDTALAQRPELAKATPSIEAVLAKWWQLNSIPDVESLPPELVERIYGRELRTSVSALEDFAACPFRFFIGRGLRAEERIEFEVDPREKGSFQHEVLKEFHVQLKRDGKLWRDLAPTEARRLIRRIGEELLPAFKDGLFLAAQARRFTGQMLIEGLERLIETLISWTRQYQFDPAAVEISFGLPDGSLPAWRIDLNDRHALVLRGRIDRVDVCKIAETGETLAVVIDYKSSARELDKTLFEHGLELQLLSYLGVLRQLNHFNGELDVAKLIPAGAFYVALKAGGASASTREEERQAREKIRRAGVQHRGRFDGGHLSRFDATGAAKGDQFRFSLKQDGTFAKNGNEALPAEEFQSLVTRVEDFLRQHGRDIYAGKVAIAPFRYRTETACDFCDYRPVCRFDPWTQLYRMLKANAA